MTFSRKILVFYRLYLGCLCSMFWKEIAKLLEELFKTKVIINPLFTDKALTKIDKGQPQDLIEAQANGRNAVLKFHHSWPVLMKAFGDGC